MGIVPYPLIEAEAVNSSHVGTPVISDDAR
jgi:hypothetical protein